MEKAEANRQKLQQLAIEKEKARQQFEIERAQREAAAKESAPWQDESWSEDGEESEDSEDIGGDVEWD